MSRKDNLSVLIFGRRGNSLDQTGQHLLSVHVLFSVERQEQEVVGQIRNLMRFPVLKQVHRRVQRIHYRIAGYKSPFRGYPLAYEILERILRWRKQDIRDMIS